MRLHALRQSVTSSFWSWEKLVENVTSNLPMLIKRIKYDLNIKLITHIDYINHEIWTIHNHEMSVLSLIK
jgi:hypothetical protein